MSKHSSINKSWRWAHTSRIKIHGAVGDVLLAIICIHASFIRAKMIWGHGVRGAELSAATSKACQFAAITSNVLKLNNRKQLKSLTSASLASKSVYQLPAR